MKPFLAILFAPPSLPALFLVAAIALPAAAPADDTLVRDRSGVALVKTGPAADQPQYPFEALAPQMLVALQAQAQKDGAKEPLDLTLDARIQFIAERALRAVTRGAVVVVDPRNGDILAAASVPSFDPNGLTEKTRAALLADPTAPLTNRILQSYAPGAAFLPVTGLAGVRAGISDKSFSCAGSVTYGTKVMKCWIADKGEGEGHGLLHLDEALKVSCGVFFYLYGNEAGIEQIQATGKFLGLGATSGLPLAGESPGILPGPDWLRTTDPQSRWSMGHTANTAIGQGMVETTPLQLAMVAATIANGGKAYGPRLFAKDAPKLRADLLKEGYTKEGIELVRHGMWKTVEEDGTGKRAKISGIEVAGRTGTAQFWREITAETGKNIKVKDNHTWFIAFAPYKEPTLAICVFVQGAKAGGGVSAPIAGRILAEALASKTEPRVAPVKPAKGSFTPVDNVK